MTIQPIIHTQLTTMDHVLIHTQKPHLVCKIVKIKDRIAADDFAAKQVMYPVKRVVGYNIFLVYAGLMNENAFWKFSEEQADEIISEMELFYKNEILTYDLKKNYAVHSKKIIK